VLLQASLPISLRPVVLQSALSLLPALLLLLRLLLLAPVYPPLPAFLLLLLLLAKEGGAAVPILLLLAQLPGAVSSEQGRCQLRPCLTQSLNQQMGWAHPACAWVGVSAAAAAGVLLRLLLLLLVQVCF
jgi:hypothetical protein